MRNRTELKARVVSAATRASLAFAMLAVASTQRAAEEGEALTTAAEIRALSEAEARKEIPALVRGVFMGEADPEGIAFVIQDETDGLYVQAPAEAVSALKRGDWLEIEGVTDPGGFAPFLIAQAIRKLGAAVVPEPIEVTLDALNSGQMDAKWVEFTGVVRSVEPKVLSDFGAPPPGTRFQSPSLERSPTERAESVLKLAAGNSFVKVEIEEALDPTKYVDAEVRVRGLCYNLHNSNRQFLRPFVQIPRGVELQVLGAPPSDPFLAPKRSVASLLQFESLSDGPGHRIHVQGVVVHHRTGVTLWVRDGGQSLRIESTQPEQLTTGDEVDVLGFPALGGGYSPILQDAIFRKRAARSSPAPVSITDVSDALRNDANLVQLQARLAEVRRFTDRVELVLEWRDMTLQAQMYLEGSDPDLSDWLAGSIANISGVCSVVSDEPGPLGGLWVPDSFTLMLRFPGDLSIVQPPPWWNAERIAWVLSGFLAIALGAIAAISYVSKRRIHDQNQRRAMAETEFSAILNERNRLAREIHDTLSQSLGAISVQLELARAHAGEISEAARSNLGTAHKLARGALAEARDSIWNMRSQVLEKYDLGGALGRILEQLTDGTGIESEITVQGEHRRLSPRIENNLLRIGQEAIVNACKHASPRRIAVLLSYEKRKVSLLVEDDGLGFELGSTQRSGRRSFGLVGMRERADLLGGEVEIESKPGRGTRVMVTTAS